MTESLKSDDNFGYIFWFLLTNKYGTQLTNANRLNQRYLPRTTEHSSVQEDPPNETLFFLSCEDIIKELTSLNQWFSIRTDPPTGNETQYQMLKSFFMEN
jgi:hypothetical protein